MVSSIYTNGSKSSFGIFFAVVNDVGETIKMGILVDHSSIFTSEVLAIKTAIDPAKTFKEKDIICFDSSSTINATENPQNLKKLVKEIRSACNKIRLGKLGFRGNEKADAILH